MLKIYNKELVQNNKLACSQNLTRPTTMLSVNVQSVTHIPLKRKMILKVYVSDDNRLFIERTAAFALNIIVTRNIMVENDVLYIEISNNKLEQLKNKYNVEEIQLKRSKNK